MIKEKKDFLKFNHWILACLVLHNMLLRYNDGWDEEYREDEEENNNDNADNATLQHDASALDLRNRVQTYILNWYHSLNP